MNYNFTDEILRADSSIAQYKEFSQNIISNMTGVKAAHEKLKEFNEDATITSRIDGLDYKSTSKGISVTGEIYSADRLRQLIYASQRDNNLAVNIQYQEGTGLKNDPFIDVANISFQYSPETGEIALGEVLDTQELNEIYHNIESNTQDKNDDSR